jgi:hypothetical protein
MVPTPVAISSSEAEFMGACTGCMAVAHIRMLVYDIEYLGTKHWTSTAQNLPQEPIVVMVDNQAMVKIAASKKLARKTHTATLNAASTLCVKVQNSVCTS